MMRVISKILTSNLQISFIDKTRNNAILPVIVVVRSILIGAVLEVMLLLPSNAVASIGKPAWTQKNDQNRSDLRRQRA